MPSIKQTNPTRDGGSTALYTVYTLFSLFNSLFKLLYTFTLTLLKVRTLIDLGFWASKQNVGVDGLEWIRWWVIYPLDCYDYQSTRWCKQPPFPPLVTITIITRIATSTTTVPMVTWWRGWVHDWWSQASTPAPGRLAWNQAELRKELFFRIH